MKSNSNIEVICITSKDCPRNAEFEELLGLVPNGRMIDFYTQDMEDLAIVAKYRVLPVPTFIIVNNGRVVGRIVHPPSTEYMTDILQNLTSMT